MLTDILLELDELDAPTQQALFDAMMLRKHYSGLARLALVTNLDPTLDLKLGKIPAAEVKAAWLQRPGRDREEVLAALRSERRVKVLSSLLARELEPQSYLAIAQANASATIALELLAHERAGEEAKTVAAANLALYLNEDKDQRVGEIRSALTRHPELMSAFALAGHSRTALLVALDAEELTPEAATHCLSRLVALLAAGGDQLATTVFGANDYRACGALVTPLMGLVASAGEATTRSWCSEPQAAVVLAALDAFGVKLVEAQGKLVHHPKYSYPVNLLTELAAALTTARQRRGDLTASSGVFALAQEATTVRTEDEVAQLLAEAKTQLRTSRDDRLYPVYTALLANEQLGVPALRAVLRQSGYTFSSRLAEGLTERPVPVQVAVAMEHPWHVPVAELATSAHVDAFVSCLTAEVSGEDMPPSILHILRRLSAAGALSDTVTCSLPYGLLQAILDDPETPAALRRTVAHHLAALMAGQPPAVWDAFERLGPNFNGTLDALVSMCVATAV